MKTSIVLTVYKQSLNEIKRWLTYFTQLRSLNIKDLQILILCDNPSLPDYYFKLFEEYNFKVEKPKKNKMRVSLIKDAIDDGLITGDYLKLCDPDDYFDVIEFERIVKILSNQDELFINIFEASIYTGYLNSPDTNFDRSKVDLQFWRHPVNFNSFYVVHSIKNADINLSFNLCDDFYFASIAMANNIKVNYIYGCRPYIWSKENGESNAAFKKTGKKFKIYDDLSKFKEISNFLTAMVDLENKQNVYFPFGFWVLKATQNNLMASRSIGRYFSVRALWIMRRELKKYKLIYNDKPKMNPFLVLKVYIWSMLGRKI